MEKSADYTDYADYGLVDARAGSTKGNRDRPNTGFIFPGNARPLAEICVI